MPLIKRSEIAKLIDEKGGANFITLTAVTIPRVLKNCPYYGLRKVSKVNCQVHLNYEAAINRALEKRKKNPNFEVGPLRWGEREHGKGLTTLDGKPHSIFVRVIQVLETKYFDDETEIDEKLIQPFLIQSPPKENVKVRTYGLNSFQSFVLNGEEFFVKD